MSNDIETTKLEPTSKLMDLFKVGAHFGYSKARSHPSVKKYIFGYKNKVTILNLEKSEIALKKAKDYMETLGENGEVVLFVGTKPEAKQIVKAKAELLDMPYVVERWIGGALTNAKEIKKRLDRLAGIKADEESGELAKYTKKERTLIAKEKIDLERNFGGITEMKKMPTAMFIIDSEAEKIAMLEARKMGIKVISLSNSDCNINNIDYPIVGNDTSIASVEYFVRELAESYREGKKKSKSETTLKQD